MHEFVGPRGIHQVGIMREFALEPFAFQGAVGGPARGAFESSDLFLHPQLVIGTDADAPDTAEAETINCT
jgi:hypothetical protein